MRDGVPAALIGAFLGLQASSVRSIVARHAILPVGMAGRAKLYDPMDVFRVATTADRLPASSSSCDTSGDRRRVPGVGPAPDRRRPMILAVEPRL